MTVVDAQLNVAAGAGTRQLNVSDFQAASTLAATEASLAVAVTRLTSLLAQLPAALDSDGSLKVADVFTGDEYPAYQTGDGTVKTFTFSAPADLIVVRCVAVVGTARCDGVDPDATHGVYCAVDEPTFITRRASTVRVLSASGTIAVWAFRG